MSLGRQQPRDRAGDPRTVEPGGTEGFVTESPCSRRKRPLVWLFLGAKGQWWWWEHPCAGTPLSRCHGHGWDGGTEGPLALSTSLPSHTVPCCAKLSQAGFCHATTYGRSAPCRAMPR